MATKKPQRDWTQFTLKIFIRASQAKVYKAWTNSTELANWFSEKAEIDPKKGGKLYFEWLAGDKLTTEVTSVTKNRRVLFPFGSRGEKVEVKMLKSGKGTVCQLRQYDMITSPAMKWEMHMGCKTGWAFFLANLKSYLEHGIDLRSHDRKQSYRQGFVNS